MENKSLNDLHANPLNPRTMSKYDAQVLEQGLKKYGDLGGIIFNVSLNKLVGGHMRVESFKRMGAKENVTYTQRFDTPTATGTTALGYIEYNGEFYGYREVSWSNEAHSLVATILANKAGGDWELEGLSNVNDLIRQEEDGLALLMESGQTAEEIEKLSQLGSEPEKEPSETDELDSQRFKFTKEQMEVVDEAVGHVLAKHVVTTENMDIRANALWFICRTYLDNLHGIADANQDEEEYKTA